jgi:hypothetical protein
MVDMEYTTETFALILLEQGIPANEIASIDAAWGEGENGYWEGGFCFTLDTKEHVMIIKEANIVKVFYSEDNPFTPPTEDYDENPDDIRRWIEAGCPPELHEF